jgi:ATP-dependent RNA helicase RhlE
LKTSSFAELRLCPPLERALADARYITPTPIQAAAIPHILAGRDVLGCAQTGTGKTAAFALPILHYLDEERSPAVPRAPRVLVLSPTRELAAQIGESFRSYGRHLSVRGTVIYGGVGQHPQVQALSKGVHIVVATPGRLLDLMNQRHVRLDGIEVLVLDEADRMLDMGFLPDLKRIVAALPRERQSLFFSATMPSEVARLAGSLLTDPVRVAVTPVSSTVETIEQRVMFAGQGDKRSLLRRLFDDNALHQVLVFTRTKRRANDVARQLCHSGVEADAIHGNKSQSARTRALAQFRSGRLRALVATDIAARGLDVTGISHVINYDLPNEPESYVHRIGRTGRAGASGIAVSFCDTSERGYLRDIERLIGRTIPVEGTEPPAHAGAVPQVRAEQSRGAGRGPGRSRGPRRRRQNRSRSGVASRR